MRIISKFHDYYDGPAKQFQDSSIVYVRENSSVDYSLSHFHKTTNCKDPKLPYVLFQSQILGFAGNIYPFILSFKGHYHHDPYLPECTIAWSYNESKSMLSDVEDDWNSKGLLKEMAGFFASDFSRHKKLFFDYKVPVFLLRSFSGRRDYNAKTREPKLELNPQLQPFGFFRKMDPYQAYQELSMFVGGVLGNTEDKIPKVDDLVRFEGKGFDKKTSFRKV